MIILNGKEYSRELINSYKNKVEILKSKKIIPSICVILVGNNYESELYVKMKKRECEQIGIKFTLFKYNETDTKLLYKESYLKTMKLTEKIMVNLHSCEKTLQK